MSTKPTVASLSTKLFELESKLSDALARIAELEAAPKAAPAKRPAASQVGEPVGQPFRRQDGRLYQKFRVDRNTTTTRCIEA